MPQTYTKGDEPVPGSGYRLLSFLGRGGFGEVWKATAPGGAEVAVKIINLGGIQGRKEFRALQLVKRIRHPNLVPVTAFWLKTAEGSVLDDSLTASPDLLTETASISEPLRPTTAAPPQFSGPQATELVMVMGLGDQSLFDRLEQCRQEGLEGIPPQELLHYMEDAARAIDYLNSPIHDLGSGPAAIQHCDIKPHNIMIVADSTQVCDFGLARMIGADRTTTAAATLAYAAPECLRDGKPSQSTDQYSLAVTYYELRTGRLPYGEETHVAVMNAKLEGSLDLSRVSGDEEVVLRRATASNPEKRYETALEMVKRLRRAVEGEDIAGRPPGAGVLMRVITTLMAIAVLGLAAYHGWRYWGTRDQELPGDNGGQAQGPLGPKDVPSGVQSAPNALVEAMKQAAEHQQQGQFALAIDDYTQALRIEPENAKAYFHRAHCYLKLEEYDRAISDFEQAKALDARQYGTHLEFAEAYLGRGMHFVENGEYEKAISDFTEATAHNPNDGRIFSRCGTVRFMLDDLEGALEDFTAAIGLDHDDSDYVRRGRVLHKLGRLDEAIADFEEACRLDPQNAEAHYCRGDAYLEKQDANLEKEDGQRAIAALDEAIRIGTQTPDSGFAVGDAYGVRGLCHMVAERFEEAAADFTQAIRRSRANAASLHESRAACYEMLDRLEPARYDRLIIGCLRRIEQDAGDHEAHNELAFYLATSPEAEIRDGTRAIEHATQACELTSWQEPEYLDTLAAAYAEAGEFEKAVQWAEKAVQMAADEEARERFQSGLDLYRAGKPHRSPLTP